MSFRRQLRHEAELWLAEGLIDNRQYQQLAERYQFNTLDTAARDRFVAILIGLGSVLIGLGIITFVAANWQELSRAVKVSLLLSLFVGVNAAGFYFWRRSAEASRRLGQGLLLLGALILGANMGLMGQMFHIGAPSYELLLAWGIGVLAMAYSLRLTSQSILSVILIGLGYWSFWIDSVFWSSSLATEFSWSTLMGQHMPLLAGLMFVPLAYWCSSRWIFGLAAVLVVSALEVNIGFFLESADWLLAIAFALPPALLWGYGYLPWVSRSPQPFQTTAATFQPLAQNLAVVFLGGTFYLASFYWYWDFISRSVSFEPSRLNWLAWLDILVLSGLTVYAWVRLAVLISNQNSTQSANRVTVAFGVAIAIAGGVVFWHTSISPISTPATWIFNTLLFLLAIGLVRQGLAQGKRRAFWGGVVLLTLRILTWFLLSITGLLFKSLVFILCGIGLIVLGLWFERYVRTLNST